MLYVNSPNIQNETFMKNKRQGAFFSAKPSKDFQKNFKPIETTRNFEGANDIKKFSNQEFRANQTVQNSIKQKYPSSSLDQKILNQFMNAKNTIHRNIQETAIQINDRLKNQSESQQRVAFHLKNAVHNAGITKNRSNSGSKDSGQSNIKFLKGIDMARGATFSTLLQSATTNDNISSELLNGNQTILNSLKTKYKSGFRSGQNSINPNQTASGGDQSNLFRKNVGPFQNSGNSLISNTDQLVMVGQPSGTKMYMPGIKELHTPSKEDYSHEYDNYQEQNTLFDSVQSQIKNSQTHYGTLDYDFDFRANSTNMPYNQANILERNIGNANNIKFGQINLHKAIIGSIHQQLMTKKRINKAALIEPQKLLSPELREIFLKQQGNQTKLRQQIPSALQSAASNKEQTIQGSPEDEYQYPESAKTKMHGQLFKQLGKINNFFLEILDSVCAYKYELGIMLQQMVECYNSIFIQQYEVFYQGKLQKEIEIEEEIKKFIFKQERVEKEKDNLLTKQMFAAEAIENKNLQVQSLEQQLQDLRNHVEELNNIIRTDKKKDQDLQDEYAAKEAELDAKDYMTKDYDRNKRIKLKQNPDSYKLIYDPEHTQIYEEIADILEQRMEDRDKNVEELSRVVKIMQSNKQVSQKTQTDVACMNNAVTYDYYSNGDASSQQDNQESAMRKKESNMQDKQEIKYQALVQKQGIKLSEDDDDEDIQQNKSNETAQQSVRRSLNSVINLSADISSKQIHMSGMVSKDQTPNHLTMTSEIKKREGVEISIQQVNSNLDADKFDLLEIPQRYANLTMRQVGIQNEKRLKSLHAYLDKISEKLKKKKMLETNQDATKMSNKLTWTIPFKIIAFAANRITQIEQNTNFLETFDLIPWLQFKDTLFDIYDQRIKHAPEINGGANTNYCPMNEFLLIYFVNQVRNRAKAEELVVELIMNLKYYFEFWQRAKIFAGMLEFVQIPTEGSLTKQKRKEQDENSKVDMDEYGDPKNFKQPHAYLKETEVSDFDIYSQEFFLHAYSLLQADRPNFLESREGMTYVRAKHQEVAAKKIIPLIKGACGDIQKWQLNRIRRLVRKLKNKEGAEVDYIDLDLVLGMMMEEFRTQRTIYQNELKRNFLRINESNVGTVDLDQYIEIIEAAMPPVDENVALENPLLQYTGKISQVRSFIYSCCSSEYNTNFISDEVFVAGCVKFAIENPVPSVSSRCASYGNSRDIIHMLQDLEKEYGKPNIRIDAKLFTAHNMGLIEKKDLRKMKKNSQDELKSADQLIDEDAFNNKKRPLIEVNETPRADLILNSGNGRELIRAGLINLRIEQFTTIKNHDIYNPEIHKIDQVQIGSLQMKIAKIKAPDKALDVFESNVSLQYPQKFPLTSNQFGLSGKQIIVPSFLTTNKIFIEHFLILRELKNKIDLLKQAYLAQMDKKKTWDQVNEILKVLQQSCEYLDFPEGFNYEQKLSDDPEYIQRRQNEMNKFADDLKQKEIDEQRQREKQKFMELQGEVGLIPESSGVPTPGNQPTQKTESIQNQTPVAGSIQNQTPVAGSNQNQTPLAESPLKSQKSPNKNEKTLNDHSSQGSALQINEQKNKLD